MQSIGHKPGLSLISILIFLVSTARTQFCDEFEQKGDNTYGLQFKDYYLLFIATHMWKLEYNAKDQTFRFGHTPEDSNHKVELFSGTLANWRFGITSWLKLSTRNKNDRHLMTGMLSVLLHLILTKDWKSGFELPPVYMKLPKYSPSTLY